MGLSLKKEEMVQFLENVKAPGETFSSMLWGTVIANLTSFQNRSAVSIIMAFTPAPGVGGSLNNAFCYIGLTERSLYVVAVDAYNTSKITGTFALPLVNISSLKVRKTAFGASHTIDVEYGGEFISLTVKSTSVGTNIKDQKERMAAFLTAMEALQKG